MTNSRLSLKQPGGWYSVLRLVGPRCLCNFSVAGELLGAGSLGTETTFSHRKRERKRLALAVMSCFIRLTMHFPFMNNLSRELSLSGACGKDHVTRHHLSASREYVLIPLPLT